MKHSLMAYSRIARIMDTTSTRNHNLLNCWQNRILLEFCCGEHSRIGQRRNIKPGCKVVRLTVKDDLRTSKGKEAALTAVKSNPNVLLWVAIPCAGGCPWQWISSVWFPT